MNGASWWAPLLGQFALVSIVLTAAVMHRTFLRSLFACFSVSASIALAVACGGKTDDGGAVKPVAATKESFIEQFCASFAPCCSQAGRSVATTDCQSLFGRELTAATYDPAKGGDCLAEIQSGVASGALCSGAEAPASSCTDVFKNAGTKKPGDTCEQSAECAPSTEGNVECAFGGSGDAKKCQLQVVGKVGDGPCVGTIDGSSASYSYGAGTDVPTRVFVCDAQKGMHCATSGTCEVIPKIGEACSGYGSYVCTRDAYCGEGRCAARKAVGSPCGGLYEECVSTAFCSKTTKTCTAKLETGAACESDSDCKTDNCRTGTCGPAMIVEFMCSK